MRSAACPPGPWMQDKRKSNVRQGRRRRGAAVYPASYPVSVLLLVNAPAQFRVSGNVFPQTSAQTGIVGGDDDGVTALVVEQDGFFFILGESVGHRGSFLNLGIKKATIAYAVIAWNSGCGSIINVPNVSLGKKCQVLSYFTRPLLQFRLIFHHMWH